MRPKPPCTCSHEVTPQHGHDRVCPRGLTMWNDHHRRLAKRLEKENRILRSRIRELERKLL